MSGTILDAAAPQSAGPRRSHTVGIVSIITVAVAVLGFLREAAIASRFGAGPSTDAYFAAIFIPYTIYFILIVGTLSPVLIQIIWNRQQVEDPVEVSETLSVVAGFVFVSLAAVIAAAMLTARWWLAWLFPGFDPATMKAALRLTQLILPAIPFLGLSGLLVATLNGFHRFKLATAAPALTSLAVIVAALLAKGPSAIYIVGLATGIGFVLQFLVLVPRVRALGVIYRPTLRFADPRIRRLFALGTPLVAYLAVANVSLLIERHLASQVAAGAVSWITYAMRLFTVPANFLAAPIAMVAYPHFAREAARPDHGELRTELARTLRYVFFIFLPVTVWFVLNALPITRVLFERGSFTLTDSQQVAHILWVYGIGILPNAITLVVLRACYALQDTVSPLIAECINLAIYSVLSVYLTHQFGITGLASARTVAFFVVLAALLVAVIRHKESLAPGFAAVMFAVRVGIASAVAGFAIWLITMKWTAHSAAVSRITDIAVLLTTGSVGFVVYLVCARILGLSETTVLLHSARDFVMRLRPRG